MQIGDGAGATSRPKVLAWMVQHRVELLFALLLALMVPLRGYWSPDEPDFAQCVREMRERGSWLLPYLNGQVYTEKPILFYWMMKVGAILGEALTGGAGFLHGVSPWAVRLPSALSAAAFLFAFRGWADRFTDRRSAELGTLVLATTPLWVWQSQFIQIDIVFAVFLAWSWLSWLGGYLVLRRPQGTAAQARLWFLGAYLSLGLAFLAKGPLALVLSAAVLGAFLLWQRDLRILRQSHPLAGAGLLLAVILPWYVAAALRGGADYAYAMIVHQNFERALKAWDHIQPWWRYGEYLIGDFFPWVVLLPALVPFLRRRASDPVLRFAGLAVLVPLVLLSCSKSKQGKYLLMAYPFLALSLGAFLRDLEERAAAARKNGLALAAALWIPALALAAVAFFGAGNARLRAQALPYLPLGRALALLLLAGACATTWAALRGRARQLAGLTAATLGLAFLLAGTWGFRLLDPQKDYKGWTRAAEPHMRGRRVFMWSEIRSGAMIYTDRLLPEITSTKDLMALGPEDRVVVIGSRWRNGYLGLGDTERAAFEAVVALPQGGDTWYLMRRKAPGGAR